MALYPSVTILLLMHGEYQTIGLAVDLLAIIRPHILFLLVTLYTPIGAISCSLIFLPSFPHCHSLPAMLRISQIRWCKQKSSSPRCCCNIDDQIRTAALFLSTWNLLRVESTVLLGLRERGKSGPDMLCTLLKKLSKRVVQQYYFEVLRVFLRLIDFQGSNIKWLSFRNVQGNMGGNMGNFYPAYCLLTLPLSNSRHGPHVYWLCKHANTQKSDAACQKTRKSDRPAGQKIATNTDWWASSLSLVYRAFESRKNFSALLHCGKHAT